MYKTYGLTGETVMVKFKDGDSAVYPWQGREVPVLVVNEYETFLTVMVLPHRALKGYRISKPYPRTILKHDILIGELIINGGEIR